TRDVAPKFYSVAAFYADTQDIPRYPKGHPDAGDLDLRADRRIRAGQVRALPERIGTEIIVMSPNANGAFLMSDSTPDGGATSSDVQAITQRAARTGRLETSTVTTANGRYAL